MNRNSTFPANVRSLTAIPVAQKAPAVRVHADHAAPCQELAGTSIATRMVPGFQVFEKQYTGGSTLPRHCHDDAYLIYGLEGAYTESYDSSGSVVCAPGVLRYLPPRQEHANVFENGARCLVVAVGREMLHRVGRHTKALDRPGEIRGVTSAWLARRLYHEFRQDDPLSLVSVEGILLEILAAGARYSGAPDPSAPAPRWLRVAREYAESNFLRTLSLAEIAGAAGVHRVHLAREFRRHFSVTVGEFLRRRRVEHACHLVSTTNDPLADVAIACGFSDQSHFCATFRRQVGLTPGRFREMAQSQ
jgi:AraC family transcriptional regulator